MDTSQERILMCKKAIEVQEAWEPQEGDWILNTSSPGEGFLFVNYKYQPDENSNRWELEVTEAKRWLLWLPAQHQLQKMIKSNNAYTLHKNFVEWMDKNQEEEWLLKMRFSAEQLWLAFLYAERYNKIWSGSDWVPNET